MRSKTLRCRVAGVVPLCKLMPVGEDWVLLWRLYVGFSRRGCCADGGLLLLLGYPSPLGAWIFCFFFGNNIDVDPTSNVMLSEVEASKKSH